MTRFGVLVRISVGVAVSVCVTYAPLGCSGDDLVRDQAPSDAVFAGTATDEGLAALDAATPTNDASKAPALTAPTAGAKVAAATPTAFTWNATPTALLRRETPRYAGSSPIGAERRAHAHGTPMNGKAYLLTLKSNGSVVARVFTTNTTFTPNDAMWTKLTTAKTIEATLATASYDNNDIVQGSGPFVAPGVTFTIE
jgi:hypothetical protein